MLRVRLRDMLWDRLPTPPPPHPPLVPQQPLLPKPRDHGCRHLTLSTLSLPKRRKGMAIMMASSHLYLRLCRTSWAVLDCRWSGQAKRVAPGSLG